MTSTAYKYEITKLLVTQLSLQFYILKTITNCGYVLTTIPDTVAIDGVVAAVHTSHADNSATV